MYSNGVSVNGHGEPSANASAGPSTSKVHTPAAAPDGVEHASYENGNEAFLYVCLRLPSACVLICILLLPQEYGC